MSGANAALNQQSITANNLANANTTGYRAEQAVFRALPVQNGGIPTRVYVTAQTPGLTQKQGPVTRTGRALDVAVHGKGWLVVQGPNGKPALTRDGNLTVSASGLLETATGYPVLGDNNQPISLPPMQSLVIASDGTVSGVPSGSQPNNPVTLGRLQLVNPPASSLRRGSNGLIQSNQKLVPDANVSLEPGALEGSNVNSVDSMIQLIQESRSFETQMRLIKTGETNAQASERIMQL